MGPHSSSSIEVQANVSLVCLYDLRYHNDHHFYKQPESEAKTISKVELCQIQTCHFCVTGPNQ